MPGKVSWKFIRWLTRKISMLFGEQIFKLQQIPVSFAKLIEGVFKTAWHKMQWEEAVLVLRYAI